MPTKRALRLPDRQRSALPLRQSNTSRLDLYYVGDCGGRSCRLVVAQSPNITRHNSLACVQRAKAKHGYCKKNQRSSGNSASSAFNGLDQDLHEGDEINIQLTLRNTNRSTASLVRAAESCPFAAPSAETLRATSLQLFVPSLLQNQTAQFNYTVIADRRGVHRFPPLKISTRAPFGLFERKRDLDQPTPILIYPEVKKLRRLSLLDRQPAAQIVTQRAGIGTEIIGVRAYRVGDSPRHIHWRTVARTNHLMSKEFADESHPGLTCDIRCQPSAISH